MSEKNHNAGLAAVVNDTTAVHADAAPHVGSWRSDGVGNIVTADGHFVCRMYAWGNEMEQHAHAHLIAAAPEMYAALKAVAGDRHACGTMRHRAEQALAKAEGK